MKKLVGKVEQNFLKRELAIEKIDFKYTPDKQASMLALVFIIILNAVIRFASVLLTYFFHRLSVFINLQYIFARSVANGQIFKSNFLKKRSLIVYSRLIYLRRISFFSYVSLIKCIIWSGDASEFILSPDRGKGKNYWTDCIWWNTGNLVETIAMISMVPRKADCDTLRRTSDINIHGLY